MILSENTKKLLDKINVLSGRRLQRSMDLGTLIEIASVLGREQVLDDLAFHAKFLTKSFDLMQRIGKDGEGYDKLSSEFSSNVQKCQSLINALTEGSEGTTASHFTSTYCTVGEMTMDNLMQLFHDLGWYKNYRIDTKHAL